MPAHRYYCKGPFLPADIRNKVFISREPSLTKLGDLSLRLKSQYEDYCAETGVEEVVILNDSKEYVSIYPSPPVLTHTHTHTHRHTHTQSYPCVPRLTCPLII
jgi:hypothetical protein